MTAIALTAASAPGSFHAAVAAVFTDFTVGIREGRDIEARYDALTRKTPSELVALGLTRSDIPQATLTRR